MIHVFIINSFAGRSGDITEMIRTELSRKENFEYLVFNSEYPGHEGVLAGQIYDLFPDEVIRFYCCGGSGTVRNIMTGLPDLSRAEIAVYPTGATNDFLAVFGKKRALFKSMDNLIHGKVVEVDYIRSNAGCALNTLSSGYDVKMVKRLETLSKLPFGVDRTSYAMAAGIAFFGKSPLHCRVEVDGQFCSDNTADMVIIANGRVLGGSFHAGSGNDPSDGLLNVLVVPKIWGFSKLKMLMAFVRGDEDYIVDHCRTYAARRINLYPVDENGFDGCYDGEIIHSTHLEAKVVPRSVKLVIPQDINPEEVFHVQ